MKFGKIKSNYFERGINFILFYFIIFPKPKPKRTAGMVHETLKPVKIYYYTKPYNLYVQKPKPKPKPLFSKTKT